ncbi:MAG: tetratricopeptide repeat protein [Chlamydiae bacterium]|nr:tetratricopeptide repeat protein [Chlamydiota bacterium]MBI3277449.1 tetratricopeptide repeat protein [Chlamydiota bacterium]
MLEEAIEKYRKIVVSYPLSPEAEQAQFQIAKIYDKFLKEARKAESEYQKYILRYPQGKFVSDAREKIK